jgi:hypothetical protein
MQFRVLAAQCARAMDWKWPSSEVRAQGMPGARCTRSPCALVVSTRSSPQVHRKSPGIPCAMVLTVSFVLSSATNSSCHRRPADEWRAEPGWADFASARLGISNGCQDHTTSPYAAPHQTLRQAMCCLPKFWEGVEASFVRALTHRSQVKTCPAITNSRPTLPRPPHPNPRS